MANPVITLLTSGQVSTPANTNQKSFTAGESLAVGELAYYKSDDLKMWKADASDSDTSRGWLGIAKSALSADSDGTFLLKGQDNNQSGLIPGNLCYVSPTSGQITTTKPSTTGEIVRVVGYAIDSDSIWFEPDKTYIEL